MYICTYILQLSPAQLYFLSCCRFLDAEWVRTKATYMQFPTILKTTRERTCVGTYPVLWPQTRMRMWPFGAWCEHPQ